ncbi:MAG: ATP-binding protein [Lachnospiraceae bacterium]|nr:ATP-binding protein [Lachnospiraceae bacterium]
MKRKLSTQLSAGFACIVLIAISLISLTANILIKQQFEKYVAEQQKSFSEKMADGLSTQYNQAAGEWNKDYIHGFGMYALQDGYIIRLYDADGTVVWDAENHDMTLCHQVMQEISLRMQESRPELEGDFVTRRYDLKQQGGTVGYLEVSYYSPYYFNENDFRFLDSLNRILFAVGILSLAGAVIAGVLLARRLSAPIARTTEITREISEGNYAIRFESDVRIQELSELSEAVNHMAEGLEAQETIRRRLTSDVAHELRTPVANVASNLEAIIEGVWEPTPERLQSCYDELGRISGIISDLEKLRQVEDENMTLKKEPVDLLELSQAVQTAFEPELEKKRLTCCVQGDPAVVLGDQKRLHQVIYNLVSNAVKYSTEGGSIQIHVCDGTETAVLTVEDHGIGIPKEELGLIFERFYRTDRSRSRRTGGAGIGLSIVRAIVQAHGGRITAESREGEGSRFTVTLKKY